MPWSVNGGYMGIVWKGLFKQWENSWNNLIICVPYACHEIQAWYFPAAAENGAKKMEWKTRFPRLADCPANMTENMFRCFVLPNT